MPNPGEDTTLEVPTIDQFDTPEKRQALLNMSDEDIANKILDNKPILENSPAPVAQNGQQTAQPTLQNQSVSSIAPDADIFELDTGNEKHRINFKNRKEVEEYLKKSYSTQQDLAGRFGLANQKLAQYNDLERRFQEAQRALEEMRQVKPTAQQAAQPVAASESGATAIPTFEELNQENFLPTIENIIKSRVDERVRIVEEKNAQLEQKFGSLTGDLNANKQQVVIERHMNNLFNEAEKFQNDKLSGGLLTTQRPLREINELANNNPDNWQLMVSPGDVEAFNHLKEMLKLYVPVDKQGYFDVTKRTLPSMKAAWGAYAYQNGLNNENVAAANAAGQQSVVQTIQKVMNQPPTIPNNTSLQQSLGQMTIEEAQAIMDMPIYRIKQDSKLEAKYNEAQVLINSLETQQ
jgi:hypothetical protein